MGIYKEVKGKINGGLPTYLITKDLLETLERKYGYNINDDMQKQLSSLQEEFVQKFWEAAKLPNRIERYELDASELSAELENVIRDNCKTPLISLDRVYIQNGSSFQMVNDFLDVTRRTDPITGAVTLEERPGSRPLIEQIVYLRNHHSEVSLADVGSFTGDTLLKIIKWLENEGISVKQVYLSVAGKGVEAKLKDTNVEVITVYGANFYEWIELRDLLGIDGRAVGLSSDGDRLYIPYWENLTEWASIPEESVEPVKEICQSSYKAIMQLLRDNGYDVSKIGRIMEYKKR